MWVAEPLDRHRAGDLAGSIELRLNQELGKATIHWLLVAPHFQRQGIGAHLLALAESTAWQAGGRTMALDTLSSWKAACEFYESAGYRTR